MFEGLLILQIKDPSPRKGDFPYMTPKDGQGQGL